MSVVLERHTDKPPITANQALRASTLQQLRQTSRERRDWRRWAKDEADDRGWSTKKDTPDWPLIRDPVAVEVIHLRPNHAAMPDVGAASFVAKAMLDGLVEAGVLAGDGPRHVRSLHFREPEVCGQHGVRLIVRELEQHLPQPAFTPPLGIGPIGD
jgi:hypothetical protein